MNGLLDNWISGLLAGSCLPALLLSGAPTIRLSNNPFIQL